MWVGEFWDFSRGFGGSSSRHACVENGYQGKMGIRGMTMWNGYRDVENGYDGYSHWAC